MIFILFLIDIIDIFISTYDVIRTPTNDSAVHWSRDIDEDNQYTSQPLGGVLVTKCVIFV